MSSEIPYTVEARPDTGLNNVKIGIWLFLASEVMLFGSFFASYILLRVGAAPGTWPEGASILNVPLAFVNTVVLITSSVTMVMAWASLKRKSLSKYKLYMGLTILCGVIFMVIKAVEYNSKFAHDPPLLPSSSTFLAIYFTMTGLHALHVVGGSAVNAYLWGPGSKLWESDPEMFTNRVEAAGLFWHLVDLIWIFLFPVLYLL